MMRKIFPLAALLALFVALSACSPAPRFEMQGTYDATAEVTESTHSGYAAGDVVSSRVEITTSGADVTYQSTAWTLTGTRAGNAVELTSAPDVEDQAVFDLTWTSDRTFEGTGRIDFSGGEYVEFDIAGEEAVDLVMMPE